MLPLQTPQESSCLLFELAGALFSVNTGQVQSIIETPKITRTPLMPDYMLGSFSHQGHIAAAVDTRRLLHLPHSTASSRRAFVIFHSGKEVFAFQVDKVIDIVENGAITRQQNLFNRAGIDVHFLEKHGIVIHLSFAQLLQHAESFATAEWQTSLQETGLLDSPVQEFDPEVSEVEIESPPNPTRSSDPLPCQSDSISTQEYQDSSTQDLPADEASLAVPENDIGDSSPVDMEEDGAERFVDDERSFELDEHVVHVEDLELEDTDVDEDASLIWLETNNATVEEDATDAIVSEQEALSVYEFDMDEREVLPSDDELNKPVAFKETRIRGRQRRIFSNRRYRSAKYLAIVALICLLAVVAYAVHFSRVVETHGETTNGRVEQSMIDNEVLPETKVISDDTSNSVHETSNATTEELTPGKRIVEIATPEFSITVDRPGDLSNPNPEQSLKIDLTSTTTPRVFGNDVKTKQLVRHVVVNGDTLWGIAESFLENPYRYPELAKDSGIRNPDLIFPGDIVTIQRYSNEQ